RHGRGRARTLPRPSEGHRCPAEVRREAGRPGDPARPGGLPTRGLRTKGGWSIVTRRGARWALGGAILAVAATLLVVSPAGAQSTGPLFIRSIDSTDPAKTNIDFVATQGDGTTAQININGQQMTPSGVTTVVDANPKPLVSVALVVDTGPNMADTNAL